MAALPGRAYEIFEATACSAQLANMIIPPPRVSYNTPRQYHLLTWTKRGRHHQHSKPKTALPIALRTAPPAAPLGSPASSPLWTPIPRDYSTMLGRHRRGSLTPSPQHDLEAQQPTSSIIAFQEPEHEGCIAAAPAIADKPPSRWVKLKADLKMSAGELKQLRMAFACTLVLTIVVLAVMLGMGYKTRGPFKWTDDGSTSSSSTTTTSQTFTSAPTLLGSGTSAGSTTMSGTSGTDVGSSSLTTGATISNSLSASLVTATSTTLLSSTATTIMDPTESPRAILTSLSKDIVTTPLPGPSSTVPPHTSSSQIESNSPLPPPTIDSDPTSTSPSVQLAPMDMATASSPTAPSDAATTAPLAQLPTSDATIPIESLFADLTTLLPHVPAIPTPPALPALPVPPNIPGVPDAPMLPSRVAVSELFPLITTGQMPPRGSSRPQDLLHGHH